MPRQEVVERLRDDGLVAILRGDFSLAEQGAIAETLLEEGIRTLELTLDSREALEGIARLSASFPDDLLVGAGTVRTAADARGALEAGARFLVAPNLGLEVLAAAHASGVPYLPGVFTATEAQTAHQAGCGLVKLFPADALGPSYLKALRAPLHDIGFMPTGGITPETLGAFHRAGAAAFGVGSFLVRDGPFTAAQGRALRTRAAALRSALTRARSA